MAVQPLFFDLGKRPTTLATMVESMKVIKALVAGETVTTLGYVGMLVIVSAVVLIQMQRVK